MAKKKIDSKQRIEFATSKVVGAGKWIVLSGTATYFLTELAELLGEFELPKWAFLLSYFIVNILSFAIGKYIEGQDK